MRINLKGINSITKRLADGTLRTYWYAWKGGPPLRGEPGTPEFIASYNAAVAQKIEAPTGTLLSLLFRFQESAEFQFGISPRTRRDYIKQIKRIEHAFGDFPIKALADPRARVGLSRMARPAGANIAAASRLCLWHVGAHSVVGARSRTDYEEPVRQRRQALSRHPRPQDLGRRGCRALPANRTALSAARDAARNQHRTTAGRPAAPAVERLRRQAHQAASAEDRRLCPDPGHRRS